MTKTIGIAANRGFAILPNVHPLSVQASGFLDAEEQTPFPPVPLTAGAKRIYNQPRQCGDWYAEIEYQGVTVSAVGSTQHDALVAVAAKASA